MGVVTGNDFAQAVMKACGIDTDERRVTAFDITYRVNELATITVKELLTSEQEEALQEVIRQFDLIERQADKA